MIKTLLKYASYLVASLILVGAIGVLVTQRISDGPFDFLQGGPFKTGELVEAPVEDWSFGAGRNVEFELVGYGTSRTAGYIMHEEWIAPAELGPPPAEEPNDVWFFRMDPRA